MANLNKVLEMIEPLVAIGKEMATQDNRMTSHPVFVVRSKRVFEDVYEDGAPFSMMAPRAFFFTNEAAHAYIRQHGHNLSEPDIYIDSGWKNDQWIEVREVLLALAKEFAA